jgi:uncharacterized membrane protein
MTGMIVLMRVIHILCGVYWAGAIFFVVNFLEPSVREVGPDGGKVMAAIQRRGYMTVMPAIALLTIASGFWLLWQASAGFSRAYMMAPIGHTYLTGAVAAIVALGIGLGVMRPKILAAGALMATMGDLDEAARGEAMQKIQKLRLGARRAGQTVAVALVLAVLTMAVGRYVPAL